jgi:hypothetical protein
VLSASRAGPQAGGNQRARGCFPETHCR